MLVQNFGNNEDVKKKKKTVKIYHEVSVCLVIIGNGLWETQFLVIIFGKLK